jgi:hypothetical protein
MDIDDFYDELRNDDDHEVDHTDVNDDLKNYTDVDDKNDLILRVNNDDSNYYTDVDDKNDLRVNNDDLKNYTDVVDDKKDLRVNNDDSSNYTDVDDKNDLDNDDDNEEGRQHDDLSSSSIEMGKDLHLLLENINKLPVPSPTFNPYNPDIQPKQYRKLLVKYLVKIKDANEFAGSGKVFLPIDENNDSGGSSNNKGLKGKLIMNQPPLEPIIEAQVRVFFYLYIIIY